MKPRVIQLGERGSAIAIPIIYEDRSVLAIDKPAGWLLAPSDWDRTGRNLQLAITSSIRGRDFWAASRNLKFLRFVHRLDADTTGALLFARSPAAVPVYSRLFESRQMRKTYLAVVGGKPREDQWVCKAPIAPDTRQPGKMRVDARSGKDAETEFRVLLRGSQRTLVEAHPLTGRTHQIRLHLAEAGCPVLGDALYGGAAPHLPRAFPLGLRAILLAYRDPFTRRETVIRAESAAFLTAYGFDPGELPPPGDRPGAA
jgi:23S rRNA pseudouridine1911/1915/1917 synthase